LLIFHSASIFGSSSRLGKGIQKKDIKTSFFYDKIIRRKRKKVENKNERIQIPISEV
jgi:hypothetical protein